MIEFMHIFLALVSIYFYYVDVGTTPGPLCIQVSEGYFSLFMELFL